MKILAFTLIVLMLAPSAKAADLVFSGQIEASGGADVSSQVNGVVADIMFRGGQQVRAGDPLLRLDARDTDLALRLAEARVEEANVRLAGAKREALRQEELFSRGVSPDAVVGRARTALGTAEAALTLAKVERDRALLDSERTTIRAPVSGVISQPRFSIGTFLEAEAGPPLASIVTLDPVRVAYEVPYASRIASRQAAQDATLEELFERITLTLTLPDGTLYPHSAQPEFASANINPETGTITVWATVQNPETLLRPGLTVTVNATIATPTD